MRLNGSAEQVHGQGGAPAPAGAMGAAAPLLHAPHQGTASPAASPPLSSSIQPSLAQGHESDGHKEHHNPSDLRPTSHAAHHGHHHSSSANLDADLYYDPEGVYEWALDLGLEELQHYPLDAAAGSSHGASPLPKSSDPSASSTHAPSSPASPLDTPATAVWPPTKAADIKGSEPSGRVQIKMDGQISGMRASDPGMGTAQDQAARTQLAAPLSAGSTLTAVSASITPPAAGSSPHPATTQVHPDIDTISAPVRSSSGLQTSTPLLQQHPLQQPPRQHQRLADLPSMLLAKARGVLADHSHGATSPRPLPPSHSQPVLAGSQANTSVSPSTSPAPSASPAGSHGDLSSRATSPTPSPVPAASSTVSSPAPSPQAAAPAASKPVPAASSPTPASGHPVTPMAYKPQAGGLKNSSSHPHLLSWFTRSSGNAPQDPHPSSPHAPPLTTHSSTASSAAPSRPHSPTDGSPYQAAPPSTAGSSNSSTLLRKASGALSHASSNGAHTVPLVYPMTASSYQLFEVIGRGCSSTVHRALCTLQSADGQEVQEEVAVKRCDLDRLGTDLAILMAEARAMRQYGSHPNILPLHCAFVTGNELWFVMPYMGGGSVAAAMRRVSPQGLEEPLIAHIAKQVLKALEYVHKQGGMHRDVKASNILVGKDGSIKLGDFGVAATLERSRSWGHDVVRRMSMVGTPCWMAPEVMEQDAGYGPSADIWSLGITLLEMAHGSAPFAHMNPFKVLMATLQGPPPQLEERVGGRVFTRAMREVVALCLQRDPEARPSATRLLKNPFFKQARDNAYVIKKLILPQFQPPPDAAPSSAGPSPTASPAASPTPTAYGPQVPPDLRDLGTRALRPPTYRFGRTSPDPDADHEASLSAASPPHPQPPSSTAAVLSMTTSAHGIATAVSAPAGPNSPGTRDRPLDTRSLRPPAYRFDLMAQEAQGQGGQPDAEVAAAAAGTAAIPDARPMPVPTIPTTADVRSSAAGLSPSEPPAVITLGHQLPAQHLAVARLRGAHDMEEEEEEEEEGSASGGSGVDLKPQASGAGFATRLGAHHAGIRPLGELALAPEASGGAFTSPPGTPASVAGLSRFARPPDAAFAGAGGGGEVGRVPEASGGGFTALRTAPSVLVRSVQQLAAGNGPPVERAFSLGHGLRGSQRRSLEAYCAALADGWGTAAVPGGAQAEEGRRMDRGPLTSHDSAPAGAPHTVRPSPEEEHPTFTFGLRPPGGLSPATPPKLGSAAGGASTGGASSGRAGADNMASSLRPAAGHEGHGPADSPHATAEQRQLESGQPWLASSPPEEQVTARWVTGGRPLLRHAQVPREGEPVSPTKPSTISPFSGTWGSPPGGPTLTTVTPYPHPLSFTSVQAPEGHLGPTLVPDVPQPAVHPSAFGRSWTHAAAAAAPSDAAHAPPAAVATAAPHAASTDAPSAAAKAAAAKRLLSAFGAPAGFSAATQHVHIRAVPVPPPNAIAAQELSSQQQLSPRSPGQARLPFPPIPVAPAVPSARSGVQGASAARPGMRVSLSESQLASTKVMDTAPSVFVPPHTAAELLTPTVAAAASAAAAKAPPVVSRQSSPASPLVVEGSGRRGRFEVQEFGAPQVAHPAPTFFARATIPSAAGSAAPARMPVVAPATAVRLVGTEHQQVDPQEPRSGAQPTARVVQKGRFTIKELPQ